VTFEFLTSDREVVTNRLSAAQRATKERMLACFTTQRNTISQFRTDVERYRWAPRYDFSIPPHDGCLYYEYFPWGMTASLFASLVSNAFFRLEVVCR
jgi:hypothetical protein